MQGPKKCRNWKYRGMVCIEYGGYKRKCRMVNWRRCWMLWMDDSSQGSHHCCCEAEHLVIVLFFWTSFLIVIHLTTTTTLKFHLISAGGPALKTNTVSVTLFLVRWRTWGHLCAASLFLLHVAYTYVILYWRTGEKNKVVNCRETSCHKRLNWARLARQISQPTACFPSVTSFVAPHRRLKSHLVPLCCTAGLLPAS